jgi:hypothetical protein
MANLQPIHVESRRKKLDTVRKLHPEANIVDVTSNGEEPWVRFSPFFPHGGVPIPNTSEFAHSVEGLWQGLKVFETEDIDPTKWRITSMKNIKRSSRSRGRVLGHRFGVGSDLLFPYRDARRNIYLPAYRWVLDHRLSQEVAELRVLASTKPLVLLDYETNCDVDNLSRPLSHGGLVKCFLEECWPV